MKVTILDLRRILSDINYLLNRNKTTLEIDRRNGFIYIQFIDTSETIFDSAVTKKELYIALQAFKKGLNFNIDK